MRLSNKPPSPKGSKEKNMQQSSTTCYSSHSRAGGRIFLIGMMGSGKSFWGKLLAVNNQCAFYDLDDVIETEERKTISDIFRHLGEKYFRELERDCLRKFADEENFILATGGGTSCFHENMKWMNEQGTTIWIDEPVEVLAERLRPEKAHRPLIKNLSDVELHNFLTQKFTERFHYYSRAQYHFRENISEQKFAEILNRNE